MRTKQRGMWMVVFFSLVAFGLTFGGTGRPASAQQPITISIIDNGGDLASTGVIIENYKKANPDKVKEIKIQRGSIFSRRVAWLYRSGRALKRSSTETASTSTRSPC